MKTIKKTLFKTITVSFIILSSIFLSNCKGHVEIFDITDSISNCSSPYIVYFKADADHRTKDLEYTWSFGDGTTSHDYAPMHIYNKDGIYQVNLHISQNKSEDSKTINLYLTDDSTQVFSDWDYAVAADELWAPAKVEFQNYSKYATSYLWVFDDGDSSIVIEPTHVYETPGTYKTALKAMCSGDTSTYTVNMNIKDSPNQILINKVTVWMPDNIVGRDIKIEIWYAGELEYKSGWINGVSSFPVTFNVNEKLFYFNGDYNSDLLEFMVFVDTNEAPEVRFYLRSDNLLDDYYPSVLSFDDGYGRALEATIAYQD
ncbi:MAG: PKD domain-containing protein [Chlorobi bacterium]|nr:PKD domain-containing protein [Chlorobiota bacterium]